MKERRDAIFGPKPRGAIAAPHSQLRIRPDPRVKVELRVAGCGDPAGVAMATRMLNMTLA